MTELFQDFASGNSELWKWYRSIQIHPPGTIDHFDYLKEKVPSVVQLLSIRIISKKDFEDLVHPWFYQSKAVPV